MNSSPSLRSGLPQALTSKETVAELKKDIAMFAVIYNFNVKPGLEDQFEKNWADMTYEFRESHGGLGSGLHKKDDGKYIASARWPDRKTWAKDKKIKNTKAMNLMKESLQEKTEVIPLQIESDLLT